MKGLGEERFNNPFGFDANTQIRVMSGIERFPRIELGGRLVAGHHQRHRSPASTKLIVTMQTTFLAQNHRNIAKMSV